MTNYIEGNLILYLLAIFVNVLVGVVVTYDNFTMTRVVPPGLVFEFVWLIIYILLGVFTVANYLCKNEDDISDTSTLCGYVNSIGESIGPFLIINLCLNILWLFIRGFTAGHEIGRILNLVVIFGILVTLAIMYQNVNKNLDVRANWNHYFGYYSWLPIYFGWIVIATILSFATHSAHVTRTDRGFYYNMIILLAAVVMFFVTFDLLVIVPFFLVFLTLFMRERDPVNLLGLLFSIITIFIGGFYKY